MRVETRVVVATDWYADCLLDGGVSEGRMRGVPSVVLLRAQGRHPITLEWLRRGLAALAWATRPSLPPSLHLCAARVLLELGAATRPATEGQRRRLAASFVQFLFERHGMPQLRRFLTRAEKAGIESAALVTFGKGFFALQWEWEEMLRSLEV